MSLPADDANPQNLQTTPAGHPPSSPDDVHVHGAVHVHGDIYVQGDVHVHGVIHVHGDVQGEGLQGEIKASPESSLLDEGDLDATPLPVLC